MLRIIGALVIVVLLVYFVFFNGKHSARPATTPQAYKAEIQKAENVDKVLQQSADRQRQQIEKESR